MMVAVGEKSRRLNEAGRQAGRRGMTKDLAGTCEKDREQ